MKEAIFSCEDAAQQVLMSSVCLSVRVPIAGWTDAECSGPFRFQNVLERSRMHAESSRMFQNISECMQNVPECMQNAPECMQKVPECSRIQISCSSFEKLPECMQLHKPPPPPPPPQTFVGLEGA